MNENTVEIGNTAMESLIAKCEREGVPWRFATPYEDMYLGFDMVLLPENENSMYVDVKNRSHNICGRLSFKTWRFHGRKPFSGTTLATHIYIEDTDDVMSLVDYFSNFVFEETKIHLLREWITDLEYTDLKPVLLKWDPRRLLAELMKHKEKFRSILKHPWELRFDEGYVDKDPQTNENRWYRMYEDEKGKKIVDYKADHLVFAFLPTGNSRPDTPESIAQQSSDLSKAYENMINKKKDVS